jgi:hypothetical protein
MTDECKRIKLYRRDTNAQESEIVAVRCGLWSCDYCAEVNKKRVMARAITGASTQKHWYLVTLTAHPSATTFESSLKNLHTGWTKLYANMKKVVREHGLGDMMYVKVWERHKDNRLHLHLLININFQSRVKRVKTSDKRKRNREYVFVSEYKVKRKRDSSIYYRSAWLADYASNAGMGYICECRPLRGIGAQESYWGVVGYISKYLTKQTYAQFPKHFHRVEFSQNFPKLPDLDDSEWHNLDWSLIFDDMAMGWRVDDTTNSNVLGLIWRWGLKRFSHDYRP